MHDLEKIMSHIYTWHDLIIARLCFCICSILFIDNGGFSQANSKLQRNREHSSINLACQVNKTISFLTNKTGYELKHLRGKTATLIMSIKNLILNMWMKYLVLSMLMFEWIVRETACVNLGLKSWSKQCNNSTNPSKATKGKNSCWHWVNLIVVSETHFEMDCKLCYFGV